MRKVVRQDEMEDIVGTVGQTFLGLTVQCGRCHDHKFDPVTMTDYYRLSSALSGVRHGERDLLPRASLEAQVRHASSGSPVAGRIARLSRAEPETGAHRLRARQPRDARRRGRGRRRRVPRRARGRLRTPRGREGGRAPGQARCLDQRPEEPAVARVIVNRLWQAHFGTGLVETPSDFGFNGGRPSHPELLDWLASELVAQGWSLKAMHRLIVTSAAYRQSSRPDPAALEVDAGDRLLWRKAPMRLEAEMVRDAMLAVSGALDTSARRARASATSRIDKAPGTPAILYAPVEPGRPRVRPPDALPHLGPRRPQRLPRRLRLPRPLDHRPAPRRDHDPAPGARPPEQRPDAPPGRPLGRPAAPRGGRRRRRGRSSGPTAWPSAGRRRPTSGSGPSASSREFGPAVARPGDLQQQRVPLRRLTDGRPSRRRPPMDRRDFFSWVRNGLAGAAAAAPDAPRRHAPGRRPRRGAPAVPPLPPRGPTRAIHICLVGAMSHVDSFDYKPGLIAAARPVARVERAARRLLRPGRPAPQARLGVPPARAERALGLGPVPAPGRGGRRADRHPLDGRRDLEPHAGDVPGEQRLPPQRVPRARARG